MAFRGRQVHESTLGQDVDLSVAQVVLLHVAAQIADAAAGHLAQSAEIKLGIEVAAVGQDRAIAHALEMLPAEHMEVAGSGHEDLAPGRGLEP